jgi:hypothetical protein
MRSHPRNGHVGREFQTPSWRPTLLARSPLELLESLSRLIPPPRVHRHHYHGVLAPDARLRACVVALGRGDPGTTEPEETSPGSPGDKTAVYAHAGAAASLTGAAARSGWVRLLARIYAALSAVTKIRENAGMDS